MLLTPNMDFGAENPFDDIYLRGIETTNNEVSNAGRMFFRTTGLPGLYNARLTYLETAAEMFAESDFCRTILDCWR